MKLEEMMMKLDDKDLAKLIDERRRSTTKLKIAKYWQQLFDIRNSFHSSPELIRESSTKVDPVLIGMVRDFADELDLFAADMREYATDLELHSKPQ